MFAAIYTGSISAYSGTQVLIMDVSTNGRYTVKNIDGTVMENVRAASLNLV